MARLVLDTNVLVSAVLASGPPRTLLRSCTRGPNTLLVSAPTLEELADVLVRPVFRLTRAEVRLIVLTVLRTAQVVDTSTRLRVIAADPDDDRILELAVDGRADLLVSGDKHLLDLEEHAGVPIVPPATAVRRLDLQ